MRRFLITLGFMTRIPIPQNIPYKEGDLEKGIVWFPVIGLILGAISAFVYFIISIFFPKEFGILLALLSNLCLTGAFHVDGLCDTVDGIYSARTRERMLEIMKDSHIGTNGVAALVIDLAWKYIGISLSETPIIMILVLPITGKMIQGILGYKAVYPRKEGLGLFVGTVTKVRVIICYLVGMIFVMLGTGLMNGSYAIKTGVFEQNSLPISAYLILGALKGFVMSVVLFIVAKLFRSYIEKKIGGITGDVMGAGSEVCELMYLLLSHCHFYM